MKYKKFITRTNLLWGIWCLALLLLTGLTAYHTLNWYLDMDITHPMPRVLGHTFKMCIMPYIIMTLFYVVAYTRKNYWHMLGMLGIDLLSLIGIIFSIRVFYEGPSLAKVSIFIIVSNILIKGCLAFHQHK